MVLLLCEVGWASGVVEAMDEMGVGTMNHMAIDQYGHAYHGLGEHPRKELMERLARSSAQRMYVDKKDGRTVHIGYIIGGLWLTLYKVEPFEQRP